MTIEGLSATEMVDLMVKFQITPKQFMLLLILETDRMEQKGQITDSGTKAIQDVYRIAELVDGWNYEELDDLLEKGLLIDHGPQSPERSSYPDNYEVTEIFTSAIMTSMSNFQELWDLYPGFVDNFNDPQGGKKIPLKIAIYEDAEALYMKYVKTIPMHKIVMNSLTWAIENGHINMNIMKYIGAKMWSQHAQLKKATDLNPMQRGITRTKKV